MGFRTLPWLLLALLVLNALERPYTCEAKELEGFGDEEVDEADDEFEEVAQTIAMPKRVVRTPAAETEEEDIEVEATVGEPLKKPSAQDGAPGGGGGSAKKAPAGKGKASVIPEGGKKPPAPQVKEEWDEDEFEGIPATGYGQAPPGAAAGAKRPGAAKQPAKAQARVVPSRKPMKVEDHIPEICTLVFLVFFAINYFVGSGTNERIALAWSEQFVEPGGVFDKNFALLGPGESNSEKEPLMIKEGQSSFKFYASGRRFCESVLVTLDLRARQDLIALLWYSVFPRNDIMKIEVAMNEECMAPFILAVTRRKQAKAFMKEHREVKELCSVVDFSSRRRWPVDDLAVITDCREAANELLNDVIVEQLFGDKAFELYAKKHFVSLLFTDQGPNKKQPRMLCFEFSIPPAQKMTDVAKLMASVFYFIDAVAKLTLSPAAKAKAEAARAKANRASLREQQEQRQEEILRKREEKRKAEEAKMSPAELARKKEKERLKELKPRNRLARIH